MENNTVTPIQPNSEPTVPNQQLPTTNYITGSQLAQQRVKLPIGIYIIAGWSLIAAVISFVFSSEDGVLLTISTLVTLLLAVGLLFRLSIVRKIMFGLLLINIIANGASIVLLARLHQISENSHNVAIQKLERIGNQQSLSSSDQQKLTDAENLINTDQAKLDRLYNRGYLNLGVFSIAGCIEAVYLTRPKVKSVFIN